jgi:AraC-like DNA-binding protein
LPAVDNLTLLNLAAGTQVQYRAKLTEANGTTAMSAERTVRSAGPPVAVATLHCFRPAGDYDGWRLHMCGDVVDPAVLTLIAWDCPWPRTRVEDGWLSSTFRLLTTASWLTFSHAPTRRGQRADHPRTRRRPGLPADRRAECVDHAGRPDRLPEPTADMTAARRLLCAKDLIDRFFAEPLDVEWLAGQLMVSSRHFSRSFRAAFAETPHQYLMTRRIEAATALLRDTDRSVTEICLAVGFTSLGSFSARFRELIGESPTQYRQRCRETGLDELAARIPSCVLRRHTRPLRNLSGFEKRDAGPVNTVTA